MALLAIQSVDADGIPAIDAVDTAVSASDTCPTGKGVFLVVINGNAGACDVTLDDPTSATPEDATAFNPDVVMSVPAGKTGIIPVPDRYKNPSSGLATVTFSVQTSVTAAVLRLPV